MKIIIPQLKSKFILTKDWKIELPDSYDNLAIMKYFNYGRYNQQGRREDWGWQNGVTNVPITFIKDTILVVHRYSIKKDSDNLIYFSVLKTKNNPVKGRNVFYVRTDKLDDLEVEPFDA